MHIPIAKVDDETDRERERERWVDHPTTIVGVCMRERERECVCVCNVVIRFLKAISRYRFTENKCSKRNQM